MDVISKSYVVVMVNLIQRNSNCSIWICLWPDNHNKRCRVGIISIRIEVRDRMVMDSTERTKII